MESYPYYEILKQERKKHLLTQEKLAEAIGADARLVRSWESGRRFPSNKYCRELCKIFEKSAEDLGIVRGFDKGKKLTIINKTDYRHIATFPPLTHAQIIQQREKTVEGIYERLIRPDITAIVVTGLGGVGKSTLTAFVAHYAKEQCRAGRGPFSAEPLWLRVDPAVTMADITGTIYTSLNIPLPDLSRLSPQNQALALLSILNTTDKPLLIILDQFENLLDWQTGQALTDRVGIGEWIDVINSQPCRCRILLTSRPWPQGTHRYPPIYMQEYRDAGLETEEGVELLQKQGVNATKEELCTAVESCRGHAFALTLLASFLRMHNLSLNVLFKDPMYTQLWTGNISRNLLDSICKQHLNAVQRKLLVAFSVYREPVLLEAVYPILDLFAIPLPQIELALEALLVQHLLQAYEEGHYQPHAIVTSYMQGHFEQDDEQINHQIKLLRHNKAAQYYLQRITTSCSTRELRRHTSDVHDLIEAIWQWCQAEQWQEAYNLIHREGIFSDLTRWGKSAILLELFQLLMPLDKWHPDRSQVGCIYNELGEVYNNLWQNERALDYCGQALHIYREVGNHSGEGRALSNLSEIYSGLGQNEQALDYCKQALHIYREIDEQGGEGRALSNLGWLYFVLGQKMQALKHFELALNIYRNIGNRGGEGIALNGLGLVNYILGQDELALDYYELALSIRREVLDRGGEGKTLNGLGLIFTRLGQYEQALDYYTQALIIHREIGERGGEDRILNNLGQVHANLGQYEQALDYYTQALSLSREVGDREGEGWVLSNLGKVYHAQGQREQALDYYIKALSNSREVGDREGNGDILYNIGILHFERKNYNIALACFLIAKSVFEEVLVIDHHKIQGSIDALREELSDEQFIVMLTQIKPRALQIVAQALGVEYQLEQISHEQSVLIASTGDMLHQLEENKK